MIHEAELLTGEISIVGGAPAVELGTAGLVDLVSLQQGGTAFLLEQVVCELPLGQALVSFDATTVETPVLGAVDLLSVLQGWVAGDPPGSKLPLGDIHICGFPPTVSTSSASSASSGGFYRIIAEELLPKPTTHVSHLSTGVGSIVGFPPMVETTARRQAFLPGGVVQIAGARARYERTGHRASSIPVGEFGIKPLDVAAERAHHCWSEEDFLILLMAA